MCSTLTVPRRSSLLAKLSIFYAIGAKLFTTWGHSFPKPKVEMASLVLSSTNGSMKPINRSVEFLLMYWRSSFIWRNISIVWDISSSAEKVISFNISTTVSRKNSARKNTKSTSTLLMATSAMQLASASPTFFWLISRPIELLYWIDFWPKRLIMELEPKVGIVLICNILSSNLNRCRPCSLLRSWWTTKKYFSFCGRSSRSKRPQKVSGSFNHEMKASECAKPEDKESADCSTRAIFCVILCITSSPVSSAIWWSQFKQVTNDSVNPLNRPPPLIKFSNCTVSFNKTSLILHSTALKVNKSW